MEFRALVGSLQLTKMEILYIQMDLQKLKIAKTLESNGVQGATSGIKKQVV